MSTNQALVFAVTHLGSLSGHEGGDFIVQTDRCAQLKQQHTPEGRRALLIHGITYAATQHATKAAFYRVAGLDVPAVAQLAGTLAEGVLHVVIDDGRLLAAFAKATKKWRFHQLGAPRKIVGVVDEGDRVRRVHMVQADDKGNPTDIKRDEKGQIVDVAGHDNPTPSTGRALLDQAKHKSLQIPLGAAVTTLVTAWLRRR